MGRVRGWVHWLMGCRGGPCQGVGSRGDGMEGWGVSGGWYMG